MRSFLLNVTIYLSLISAFSPKAYSDNYWDKTSITYEVLRNEILTPKNCDKNKNYYSACYLTLKVSSSASKYEKNELLEIKEYAEEIYENDSSRAQKIDQLWSEINPNSFLNKNSIGEAYNLFLSFAKDPHSYIIPKEEVQNTDNDEVIESGVGIYVVRQEKNIFIYQIMDDSPAQSAGLKVGDQLISIDNKEIEKIDYYQIPKILSNGKVGTLIHLKILRDDEPMTFNIARARIIEKSLHINEALNQSGHSATIFKLRNFSNIDSYFEIKKRVNEKHDNHLGWIFDLRNNGGGDMENAQSIAGLFIEDQIPNTNNPRGLKTIYLRQPFNAKDIYFAQKTDVGQKTIEPVVIITNASTASAAEMFASSLRDYDRALIIGERSFGKATTQRGDLPNSLTPGLENISDKILNTLQNDFIYYSSFAVFYAPISMSTHQLTGIIPDIAIENPSPIKKSSLREEDLFLNPIKVHPKAFINSDSRLKKIDQAKNCSTQNSFNSGDSIEDIEIKRALDILQCQKI